MGSLPAQTPAATPDANPEGNTGALKAQVTTGGSYDAHSGNATRSVNDLHVPGALGVYGLDFTRYWNSIPNDHDNSFAALPISFGASGWSHSWEWHAQEEDYSENIDPMDDQSEQIFTTAITITFPDGHANRYKITRSNRAHGYPPHVAPPDPRCGPPYSVPEQNAFLASGPLYDYLSDMAADGSAFWLYRADGGAVRFEGGSGYYYATEVFDPHGLRTELRYDANSHLYQVVQDGGRWLTITWNSGVITRVETGGYAGSQGVDYGYATQPGNLGTLSTVTYPEGAQAVYTYANCYGDYPCNSNDSAFPMLKVAYDPHYAGAMTRIRYAYRGTTCLIQDQPAPGFEPYYNAKLDYYLAPATSISAEKSGDTGVGVSSFGIGCFNGTRTETNGFGGWRIFNYGHSAGYQGSGEHLGYQLIKLTDFTNQYPLPGNLPFERQNYLGGQPHQVWDGRGIETDLVVTGFNYSTGQFGDSSGQPGEIHHVTADGSYQIFNRVNPTGSDAQDFALVPNRYNHWLFSHRDERGLTTTYRRDSRRRVVDITYPDTNSEHFTYNDWNQVVTHTLPSNSAQQSAVVTYEYDTDTHRLLGESNSIDGIGARKEYIYDEAAHPDLVHKVIDARARSSGAPYSTRMEYDGGNRIIEVHYAPTPGLADPHVSYGYDIDGNCNSITDEIEHTSHYEYDSYRRCISYTEPLNAPGWNGQATVASRTWLWYYDRWIVDLGPAYASAHTKNEWRLQIEPAFNAAGERRMTARAHDLQNRLVIEQTGWIQRPTWIGDWYASSDLETHYFSYDGNGNKSSYTDPMGRVTSYTYDNRNRLWQTIEPLNRVTQNQYDVTSNKTLVTFPDNTTQQWLDFTPFGQAERFIDEHGNTTNLNHKWGPMKKLASVVTHRDRDGGGTEDQTTTFTYDGMGRPTQVLFPDWSHEDNTYGCGNGASYNCDQVHTWQTRKGQLKTITYDARGRESSHTWSDDTPGITRIWDPANRLTNIANTVSALDYQYDAAGQVLVEGNTITGSSGRAVTTYHRYPDGQVSELIYPYGRAFRRDYNSRSQLASTGVSDGNGNWIFQFARYLYRADGKLDHEEYGNGMTTLFGYDDRGFVSSVLHKQSATNQTVSSRTYTRDSRDRIISWVKGTGTTINPMENGRGNRYAYDEEGQLVEAWYGATNPAVSGDGNSRYDGFNYDALGNRKGSNYVANRGLTDFSRKDTGLNQYRSWTPSVVNYDDDIGQPWGTTGAANGVLMQDGWITAGFNALNQPMYIWSATAGWTNFGYDPLGRCVKRWRDGSPATYLYYDGWNLIQEGPASGGTIWDGWSQTPGGVGGANMVYLNGARVDEIVFSVDFRTMAQAFFQYDGTGNCSILTDWGGTIMEQYDYDAFGQPYFYDASGNNIGYSPWGNRFLFTGREWLSDLKLYDYRNRLYQPELGRFLQPDPKEFAAGDYNLYRYCHNDPVNRNDPFGLYTAVIVGLQRDDSDNVFGHVAVAMTGQGVFSYGTAKTDWAASATGFVSSQSEHRTQFVYTVATTPGQEQAIRQSLDAQNKAQLPDVKKDPVGGYKDNCATRTSEALKAGGIDIGKAHTPNQVASKMEKLVSQDKAKATTVPTKANIENYPKLKELDPRR